MNPPFDRITATCFQDGPFQIERKPKKRMTTCGHEIIGYAKVVCPTCRMWATVDQVEEVRV